MKFEFDKNITDFLKIILKNAQTQSVRVFFVGGIVRDNILGKKTKDIDLIIESNAIEFSKSLPSEIQIKSIHEDFKTVKIIYKDIEIDLASTREEVYPFSGCLPKIISYGVKIENDVKRRDFTINSLYCELILINNEIKYNLIDLVDGLQDIKNKTLKVLHEKSYIDDPTRILRGLDFKYRFNFNFSNNDKLLIKNYMNNISYQNASYNRILSVFKKNLTQEHSNHFFKEIIEKKYYKILKNQDIQFNSKVFEIFKLNQEDLNHLYCLIIENHSKEKYILQNKLEIYNTFSKLKPEEIAYYYHKTKDKNAILYNEIKNISTQLKGEDLINLGYSQGKNIGLILSSLLEYKLETQEKMTKQNEINWVLKHFPKK